MPLAEKIQHIASTL